MRDNYANVCGEKGYEATAKKAKRGRHRHPRILCELVPEAYSAATGFAGLTEI